MNESTVDQVKEELFVSLSLMRAVKTGQKQKRVQRVSPSEIYRYVLSGVVDTAIDTAIIADSRATAIYHQLVKDHALFHIPHAAAASSDEALMERISSDVVIQLIPSRMEQDQIYLQVELSGELGGKDHAVLNVFGRMGEQSCVQLTGIADGRCQLLMSVDEDLIQLLQQIDSEVFVV